MPTNNAWNSTLPAGVTSGGTGVSTITGVITGNGVTPFSASTLIQYNVLVGGMSNSISSIGPGTSGQVFTSNGAGANPSYQSIGTIGAITTITGNDAVAEVPSGTGNFNIVGTGSITTVGSANTETIELTGLTAHNVLLGEGTATIGLVAPSATSGVPLISQGASADPTFGTAVVAGGGTGNTTFTAYSVICAGTTATGAFQNVSGVGTSGQVLTSNGAAALPTWQAGSGGSGFTSINVQTFTSSGTYTPTSGMKYCIIEVVGGGGGGGGAAGGATGFAGGAGGGYGGYSKKFASSATVGASQTVTIGAAGSASTAGNNPGGGGGTSSVGAIVSATGGSGGAGSASITTTTGSFPAGGAGGVGSSGDVNGTGAPGGNGFTFLIAGTFGISSSGAGGSGIYGAGGAAVDGTSGQTTGGNAGVLYGGGGSGGIVVQNASGSAGAAGAKGIAIITEFIS